MPKLTGTGDTNELYCVTQGNLSYNSLGRLKQSLALNIVLDERLTIDYLNDRVQATCEIDGLSYPLGVFLISTSSKETTGDIKTRSLTCYSMLKILANDKVLSSYFVSKNTNIVNEVLRLLGDNDSDIPLSAKTTSCDRTWDIGTAKLDIINDLLDSLNYTSLIVDNNGTFVSKPYVEPSERTFTIEYKDNEILESYTEEVDAFDIPNVFVKYTSTEEQTIIAKYPLDGTTDGRLPNPNVEQVDDVSDQETLYKKCKRAAIDSRSVYEHFTFKTPMNPAHGYLDCIYVHGDNYIETSWSCDLKVGGEMRHSCRRVVDLDD